MKRYHQINQHYESHANLNAAENSFENSSQLAPEATFRYSLGSRMKSLIIGGFIATAGLVLLTLPLTYPNINKTRAGGQAMFLGGLGCAAGAFLLFNVFRSRGITAKTSSEGVWSAKNGVELFCRWENVERVEEIHVLSDGDATDRILASFQGQDRMFIVVGVDGRVLEFGSFLPSLDALGEIIQQATLPHMLDAAKKAFEATGSLSFGAISFDEANITANGKQLPWEELESIRKKDGKIVIRKSGKRLRWRSVLISETPNVHVLMAMFAERGYS